LATDSPTPEQERARQIFVILRGALSLRDEDFASVLVAKETGDPFRVLVVTILSQSCTDIAAIRAYRSQLAKAKVSEIEKAVRVAGLHRQKARALKRIAQLIAKRYSGDLRPVVEGPLEEARLRLQELPKVGPKTADVLLGVWGRPTISVDTHVNRVSKRLGLAHQKAKYEEVRATLMQIYDPADYRSVPLLFMAHGRKTCGAPKPRCSSCPVEKLCPFTKKLF